MRFDRGTDPRATALRLIAECRDAQNTTLDLSSVGLTLLEADVVAGLTSLSSLTSLNLQDNEIGPDGAQALAGLTGLTSLILGINTIGAEGAQALKGLTRLTNLGLWNCKIGDRGAQALAGLTSLTTLVLGDNDISDEGAWALSGLTNLTELFLWKNAIGADGAQALKGLTGLTKLDMLENRIGSDGAQALKGLTALTCLNLSDNNIGDEGVQALKGLTDLTWLDLSDNNISDDGVQALKGLTNLTRLELSGNTIRGNGPRALTGLTALTDLDLSRNQIGDEGAQASTALTSLTHLDLSRNPIGDQGALALLHLPSLTGLDLKDNKLGDDVASEVERVISLRRPAEPVDPTTPEELLALAKHLAADPKLDAIFRRVGLHKPFIRPDEYFRVIDSREAFAPHLHDRPCSSSNLPLAEALARRLHAGHISSDAGARAFLADRIRHYPSENKDCSVLLESEVKDIMRNLLESSFFQKFEDYRRRKAEVIETGIDPYEHMVGFVGDQMWIYGLGGRGWSQIELVVISCLNRLWFDAVPDLSPATVERMLQSPREFLSLYGDKVPRKG